MPTMPLVGDELAGYRLVGVVGRGGLSVVYRAENPRLGSTVALKVLAPEIAMNDLFRTRFLQESRIAASLSHPNVIPIFDMGSHADLLYIAMRYVNGHDMRDLLKSKRGLGPLETLYLVSQCGRALDYAHRHSLVHRDVKPANLLVEAGADEEDADHVFLADFGITKHTLSRTGLTPTGQFMGTLDYVAPEQIQGREVGKSSDIYSLGCVLYEGLTGQVPFVKELDAAVLWAHVEELAPPPTSINPSLPSRIDDVIARVLSKDPADRYGTCHELVTDARAAFARYEQRTAISPPIASHRRPPPDEVADAQHDASGIGADTGAAEVAPASADGGKMRQRTPPKIAAVAGDPPASPPPSGSENQGASTPAPKAAVAGRHPTAEQSEPEPPDWVVGPGDRDDQGVRGDQGDGRDDRGGSGGSDGPGGPRGPGEGRPNGSAGAGAGGYRRRAGLAAAFASLLVLAVVMGIWVGAQQRDRAPNSATGTQDSGSRSGSSPTEMSGSMSMSPSASGSEPTSALQEAIRLANLSTGGMLPTDRCTPTAADEVACDRPHDGIYQARFRTYPSLGGVYANYVQRVRDLSDGRFGVNYGDCTRAKIDGEVSWNHDYVHPRQFTLAQVRSGTLRDDTQAAGRVFCRLRNNVITIVWTDNHAVMLGTVTGSPHSLVFRWWKRVHHDLAVGDMPMDMH